MLHPPDVHPQQKSQSGLLSLISRHPLMVLGLGWGVMMIFAAFGLATLLSPGRKSPQTVVSPSPPSSPETITVPVTSASSPAPQPPSSLPESSSPAFTAPSQSLESAETADASTLPLWLFGVIALSCAGGSCLLTLALKQVSANSTRRRKARRRRKKRVTSSSSRRRSQRVSSPYQRPNPEPRVTILPPDVSHPLDSDQDDQDLATEMDLRKHHSLSSLLRDL